jgi:hypothetical protein
MFRTQIQLTQEQARSLKLLAARQGKSIAELIRISVDSMLRASNLIDPEKQRQRAIAAAGKLQSGPQDLSTDHDRYLSEAYHE